MIREESGLFNRNFQSSEAVNMNVSILYQGCVFTVWSYFFTEKQAILSFFFPHLSVLYHMLYSHLTISSATDLRWVLNKG